MSEPDWAFLAGFGIGLICMLPFKLIITTKRFVVFDSQRGWVFEWRDT